MNPEAWIALGITVVVFGALLLLVFETVRLARREPPITFFTRGLVRHYPGWAMAGFSLASFVLGLLIAHFAWQ